MKKKEEKKNERRSRWVHGIYVSSSTIPPNIYGALVIIRTLLYCFAFSLWLVVGVSTIFFFFFFVKNRLFEHSERQILGLVDIYLEPYALITSAGKSGCCGLY